MTKILTVGKCASGISDDFDKFFWIFNASVIGDVGLMLFPDG